MKINAHSDFSIKYKFVNRGGDPLPIPDFPFDIMLKARGSYFCSYDGSEYTNCRREDDNTLMLIVARHNLGYGKLTFILRLHRPNGDFPEDTQYIVDPVESDIELWAGRSDDEDLGPAEVEKAINVFEIKAYDVAKKHGYTGTMEEYNEYLAKIPALYADLNDIDGERIKTGIIKSKDGKSSFNLENGLISGKMSIQPGSSGYKNLDDLPGSGRNYLDGSDNLKELYCNPEGDTTVVGYDNYLQVNIGSSPGFVRMAFGDDTVYLADESIFKSGEPITFSLEIKGAPLGKSPYVFLNNTSGYMAMNYADQTTDGWMRYYVTWVYVPAPSSPGIHVHFGGFASGTYYLRRFKLEVGSVPTDYCPSYDDYAKKSEMSGVLKFDSMQTLTKEQKQQVRQNIDVYSSSDVDAKIGNIEVLLNTI